MAKPAEKIDRVGIRELRQNLSRYVEKVKAGRRIEVTDHGHPVAMLIPLPPARGLAWLEAMGLVIPPEGRLEDVLPPPGPISSDLSDALEEMRQDRF